jgi:putative ABC transport system ATP-binding protein
MTEPKRGPIIVVERVSKTFTTPDGELTVLDDINFSVDQADKIAIFGVSGSGKSTLLALLAGLDLPTTGRVLIDGNDLTAGSEDQRAVLRNRYVGFVFQQFHLLPNLTAVENVMLPLELSAEGDPGGRAKEALVTVGLRDRLGHFPRQLSGGEQQRVALARAFCTRPKVLFADEPTGNLDEQTAAVISDLMFELNHNYGTTLVLVTHDAALAARCEHRLRLEGGRIEAAACLNG